MVNLRLSFALLTHAEFGRHSRSDWPTSVRVDQMTKGQQIPYRLASGDAPCPLPADRSGEPALQDGVEVSVGGGEHHAEHRVELVDRQCLAGQPPDQMNVAGAVERVRDGPESRIALQQEPVHLFVVLVRGATHEGLDQHLMAVSYTHLRAHETDSYLV